MKVIFVTGGAGFIGSHFVKYFLRRNKNFIIVNMDKLSYTGSVKNFSEIEDSPRHHFIKGDICNQDFVNYILKRYRPDYIINFAAESNPLRSTDHLLLHSETNIIGTLTLLEGARYIWSKKNYAGNRFIQVSTDEVYGFSENPSDFFNEDSIISPRNPYAASKASADLLTLSYFNSFGFPGIITRGCNTYGPNQFNELLVPSSIKSTLEDRQLSVSAEETLKREWIYVLDHCIAIIRTMFYGSPGEIYNIGSGEAFTEQELSIKVQNILGKNTEIPADLENRTKINRYNFLNSFKIRNNLKWSHKLSIDNGLKETISWYLNNKMSI